MLHACAHNPTGVDPSVEQWKDISMLMKVFALNGVPTRQNVTKSTTNEGEDNLNFEEDGRGRGCVGLDV